MVDAQFSHARLAPIYDDLDSDRGDLDLYVGIASELGARSVLDVGCGTGSLAVRLAGLGFDVTGIDPAAASVDVARSKPDAKLVTWAVAEATSFPPSPSGFDLAVMTGNVAQVFVDDDRWRNTLSAVRMNLNATGTFVFETRDPAVRAWEDWNITTERVFETKASGPVGFRREVVDVDEVRGIVTFEAMYRFDDGVELTSSSTLRFCSRTEIEADLTATGFGLRAVRDAPDRPGLEFVFLACPVAETDPS